MLPAKEVSFLARGFEINKDLQRIEIMMQKASKENVYLPTLATDILHIIDKYNLYQLSERTS